MPACSCSTRAGSMTSAKHLPWQHQQHCQNPQARTQTPSMAERMLVLSQEVEVRQAVQGEQQGLNNMLPQIASPGDLLLENVDASDALSVLVQQPAYQVQQHSSKAARSTI